HELARAGKRLPPTPSDDRARDLARVPLFPVRAEDLLQVTLARLVYELGGRRLGRRVHAHVERRVDRIRETTLRTVQLHARDAEVEQNRVHLDPVGRELRKDDRELAAEET